MLQRHLRRPDPCVRDSVPCNWMHDAEIYIGMIAMISLGVWKLPVYRQAFREVLEDFGLIPGPEVYDGFVPAEEPDDVPEETLQEFMDRMYYTIRRWTAFVWWFVALDVRLIPMGVLPAFPRWSNHLDWVTDGTLWKTAFATCFSVSEDPRTFLTLIMLACWFEHRLRCEDYDPEAFVDVPAFLEPGGVRRWLFDHSGGPLDRYRPSLCRDPNGFGQHCDSTWVLLRVCKVLRRGVYRNPAAPPFHRGWFKVICWLAHLLLPKCHRVTSPLLLAVTLLLMAQVGEATGNVDATLHDDGWLQVTPQRDPGVPSRLTLHVTPMGMVYLLSVILLTIFLATAEPRHLISWPRNRWRCPRLFFWRDWKRRIVGLRERLQPSFRG